VEICKPEERVTPQHKSAIKSKYAYAELEDIGSAKRDSPIARVKEYFEDRQDAPFALIKTPSPRNGAAAAKKEAARFAPISYQEEGGPQQKKIKSTARLIDEQLVKIKAKIDQSEANQKKIESYRPNGNFEPSKTKEHTTRIAENISAQVKLDAHLKPARLTFEKVAG
jgi:hypothetical protein